MPLATAEPTKNSQTARDLDQGALLKRGESYAIWLVPHRGADPVSRTAQRPLRSCAVALSASPSSLVSAMYRAFQPAKLHSCSGHLLALELHARNTDPPSSGPLYRTISSPVQIRTTQLLRAWRVLDSNKHSMEYLLGKRTGSQERDLHVQYAESHSQVTNAYLLAVLFLCPSIQAKHQAPAADTSVPSSDLRWTPVDGA